MLKTMLFRVFAGLLLVACAACSLGSAGTVNALSNSDQVYNCTVSEEKSCAFGVGMTQYIVVSVPKNTNMILMTYDTDRKVYAGPIASIARPLPKMADYMQTPDGNISVRVTGTFGKGWTVEYRRSQSSRTPEELCGYKVSAVFSSAKSGHISSEEYMRVEESRPYLTLHRFGKPIESLYWPAPGDVVRFEKGSKPQIYNCGFMFGIK